MTPPLTLTAEQLAAWPTCECGDGKVNMWAGEGL